MRRCYYCNTEKPDESFAICRVIGDKVYRRRRCWRCKSAAEGGKWRKEVRRWFCEHKKTLHCVRCNFADHRALDFHHEGTQEKERSVADMLRCGCGRERIMREIAKCIVLCSNCHRIEHAEKWLAAKSLRPALPRNIDAAGSGAVLLGTRKVCRYCLVEQDESCFEVCKVLGGKVYRRHKCRACKAATQTLRRERLRAWLDDRKKTLHCAECGFSDFRALEFHHPDAQEKDFAIGEMVKDNRSITAIEREMARCVALCANCHRITHYSDRAEKTAPRVQAASSPG
jgi:hypothetical protein